jgi:hypothetical protein
MHVTSSTVDPPGRRASSSSSKEYGVSNESSVNWRGNLNRFSRQDVVECFNKHFRRENLKSTELKEAISSTSIFDFQSKSGWKHLNSGVLLKILVIGQEDQLQNYIQSKFNEYMALQMLKLIAPKILMNESYHSWTWVHILIQCVKCDTYDEGRRTLITILGVLINRTDSWFPVESMMEIWEIAVQDYRNGYERVRDFTMSQLNVLNGDNFLCTKEEMEKITGQLQIFKLMYRDDNRDKARGCQCQIPLGAKETNNSVPASACADPHKLEPDKLSDKELKIIHQYYQTVHATKYVESLPSVATMNLNLQPNEVKTFGFGGITAEAVKKLKAPEQGSYFCFKATVSVKRKFSTVTSRTKKWFTYQFVDEGAQTNSNINKDDDVGVGISYLTNLKHLVKKKEISMRWETRRKRSSTCSSKMAKLKDGTVEDSQKEYNHLMKGLLKPVEDAPRDEEDFNNRKSVATGPADWEDWKKKKKEA